MKYVLMNIELFINCSQFYCLKWATGDESSCDIYKHLQTSNGSYFIVCKFRSKPYWLPILGIKTGLLALY